MDFGGNDRIEPAVNNLPDAFNSLVAKPRWAVDSDTYP